MLIEKDNSSPINIQLRNQGLHKTYCVTSSNATHVYDSSIEFFNPYFEDIEQ